MICYLEDPLLYFVAYTIVGSLLCMVATYFLGYRRGKINAEGMWCYVCDKEEIDEMPT